MQPTKKQLVEVFIMLSLSKLRDLVELYELSLDASEKYVLYSQFVKEVSQKFATFENIDVFKTFSKCVLISVCYKLSTDFFAESAEERERFYDFSKKIMSYMDTKEYDISFKKLLSEKL